jgi:hypothetical protein
MILTRPMVRSPAPPARWKRCIAHIVRGGLLVALWGLGAALFLTGAVMAYERGALLRSGVALEANVESCRWESMFRSRLTVSSRGGSGYYSCHYTYRASATDPPFRGYFQSAREWRPGDSIPIRYRPDRPAVSATEHDLENPWTVPVGLMALPVLYGAFRYFRRRRERVAS